MKKALNTKTMLLLTGLIIFVLGLIIHLTPSSYTPKNPKPLANEPEIISSKEVKAPPEINIKNNPTLHAQHKRLEKHFQRAIVMLHAKRYELAIVSLHQVLAIDPKMPEAHINMGFALLGNQQAHIAEDFFLTAIDLDDKLLNAYYGLALSHGEQKQYQSAIAAMVSFIHLSNDSEQYLQKALDYLQQWRDLVAAQQAETQNS